MDQIAIGARIKAARERIHLSPEQLAEIIDISLTHTNVTEQGVKTPKWRFFIVCVRVLWYIGFKEGGEEIEDSVY